MHATAANKFWCSVLWLSGLTIQWPVAGGLRPALAVLPVCYTYLSH